MLPLEPEPEFELELDSFDLNIAEKRLIECALERAGGIVAAAKLLGITRHAVKRRIIKYRIEWRRPQVLTPVLGDEVMAVATRPVDLPSPQTGAERVFSWLAILAPRQVWQQETGDALEVIAAMRREGCPEWKVKVKIISTVFWVFFNAIREIVGSFAGRKK